jgi:subtilase family serine protease
MRSHLAAIAAAALGVAGLAAIPATEAAHAAPQRQAIAGTQPSWAARSLGPVTTGTVDVNIYVASRDAAGLAAYATAVSTPGRALYRHFLSAAQMLSRYGPSRSEASAVESWAGANGLRVTGVTGGIASYVSVTGSVSAASRAFGVRFGLFHGPGGGTYRAPEEDATVPASLASDVLDVSGLDTAPDYAKPMSEPPPGPNYWVAKPCASYYGQIVATNEPQAYGKNWPWTVCGYTPAQVRSAYGVTASGMTGKGQTVAIVDAYASPTMPADANRFAKVVGDKPFAPGQFTQSLPSKFTQASNRQCGAQGWYGEETLDIEAVHGQAPDADVHFVAAASCSDVDLTNALALIVNDHLASIVSNSWGEPANQDALTEVNELVFQAGAAEGIGFFFSSGDNGYESPAEDPLSNQIQVDYPTSSPWVTSVGGTSLAIGATDNYQFETSWGTLLDPLASNGLAWAFPPPGEYPQYYDGSSGGGTSTQFSQPAYQTGVVPDNLSHTLPGGATSPTAWRVVPDVSALADPSTGVLVGQTILEPNGVTYGFALSRIGGTSVSCPVFAGIEADAQQAAGHDLGFANPAIYQLYGTPAFRDVTDHPSGTTGHLAEVRTNYSNPSTKAGPLVTWLRTLGIDGEGKAALPAVPGYDDATGIGSPAGYIQALAS